MAGADNILAAAVAIAAKLETLPDIERFYPHYRAVSVLGDGEGMMTPTGFTIPETMGGVFQQVTWSCLMRFQSALTSPDVGEGLNERIINLCSADPSKGIIGLLHFGASDLDKWGNPRVTSDGIDPDYDTEQDDSLLTFLPFNILSQVPMTTVVD